MGVGSFLNIVIGCPKEVQKSNFRQYGQMKSRDGKSQREEKSRREKVREERVRRKKLQVREKVGKSRNTVFFPMICGSRGSKSGAEPHEKLHFVVARSTFRSQNVQSTPGADHFWQLRCSNSVRCCGAKHISKSKV